MQDRRLDIAVAAMLGFRFWRVRAPKNIGNLPMTPEAEFRRPLPTTPKAEFRRPYLHWMHVPPGCPFILPSFPGKTLSAEELQYNFLEPNPEEVLAKDIDTRNDIVVMDHFTPSYRDTDASIALRYWREDVVLPRMRSVVIEWGRHASVVSDLSDYVEVTLRETDVLPTWSGEGPEPQPTRAVARSAQDQCRAVCYALMAWQASS